ncbi:MAG: D-alanyl-D-alanine carboxypeptidase/D-alanyl-D-alanine-endopeptidase [Oleiphilaceae bacterium]|nr:D-alanyl-D-alanine carboxypeptidase/D-alanyl-D-alanine-endopeptidase [Oleiphilaceae bacterium]
MSTAHLGAIWSTPAFLLCLTFTTPLAFGADTSVTGKWSGKLQAYANEIDVDAAGLAAAVIPLNGPGLEQYINADIPMNPGSIMKVLTTYAALEILGPDYHWETRFFTDGQLVGNTLDGNLYVEFSGDPKLTIERLWTVIGELRGMGVSAITGDLVLDGHYFRLPERSPIFHDNGDNPHAPFLVKPSAYLTNLNVTHFEVRADERGTRAWSKPAFDRVVIDNRVTAMSEARCPARSQFEWTPQFHDNGHITVKIEGKLARGCRTSAYLSLLAPEDYSGALIQSLWQNMGGTLAGTYRTGVTPPDARLMMAAYSPDLVTIIRDINKWSSNVMARQLLLNIGAENRQPGELDDRLAGIRTILEWLESKNINTAGMVIDNGAGLSRHGRLSARQTAQILQQAWNSPFAADLMSSLPLIAMDGTMARRLRNTALTGEGRIKTGYLQGVRSIAGYSRDKSETNWVVVGMVNHDPAWNGQAVLDRMLYSLYFTPPLGTALSQAPDSGSSVR